jgi:hypothetical protein
LSQPAPTAVDEGEGQCSRRPRKITGSADQEPSTITPGEPCPFRGSRGTGSQPGAGALFGLAIKPGQRAVYYVDDATNTLNLLHH